MYNLPGMAAFFTSPEKAPEPAAETPVESAAAQGSTDAPTEDFIAASAAELIGSAKAPADDVIGVSIATAAAPAVALDTAKDAIAAVLPDAPTAAEEQLQLEEHKPEAKRTLTREEEIEEALNCPCIDAMRDGPCGKDFIAAYRCFLESDSEPQGMDCVPQFATMQSCMAEHPEDYGLDDDEDPLAKATAGRETAEPAPDTDAVAPDPATAKDVTPDGNTDTVDAIITHRDSETVAAT